MARQERYRIECNMPKRISGNPEDSARRKIPSTPTLQGLAKIAKNCKACDLWKRGTQTVFGEGEPDSKVMFVGEVPGDQEDRVGKPFVGPAGNLLNKALAEAGIDRSKVYVTNCGEALTGAAGEVASIKSPNGRKLPRAGRGLTRKC